MLCEMIARASELSSQSEIKLCRSQSGITAIVSLGLKLITDMPWITVSTFGLLMSEVLLQNNKINTDSDFLTFSREHHLVLTIGFKIIQNLTCTIYLLYPQYYNVRK